MDGMRYSPDKLLFGTCLRPAADLREDSEGILLRISFPKIIYPATHLNTNQELVIPKIKK